MEFVVDVVALQPLEKVQQRVAEYRPRPSFGICGILRDAVFDVVADTLEQRVEQVFLIFKMPIERAARYAGGLGDFVERCARNPFAVKGFQGGKHQVFFGFQGFGFGFSHNGVFVPSRFDGWDYKKDFYPCNRVCIMKPIKLRLHLNFENRYNLLCNPFEHSGIKAGGFYILK